MRAVVVHETFFGNTRELAQAVADGIRAAAPDAEVTVHSVRSPPPSLDGVDLLVVGAPTHAHTLSSALTRWLHAQYWGDPAGAPRARRPHGRPVSGSSVRGWLAGLPARQPGAPAAAFDSRLAGRFRGGAAPAVAKRLRDRGHTLVVPPEGFVVDGVGGPLRRGELQRATSWGSQLAGATQSRASTP
jgi:hypothetical protein